MLLSQGVCFEQYNVGHHAHHTARARVGPLNLRRISSLGRSCRKNKLALDEPLQERETALEECPTIPQTDTSRKLKSYFTNETYPATQPQPPFLARPCIRSLRITFRHRKLEVI